MASIHFNVSYHEGEYYSPIDLFNIVALKYKGSNYRILFLPIRILVFIPTLLLSLLILPFYLINQLFLYINDSDNMLVEFIMWILNIFYLIAYWIYKILCFVELLLCSLYQAIQPLTEYESQSFVGESY